MSKPYLFEMLARKTVVVWADSAEEAQEISLEHLANSDDWEGVQSDGGEQPISEAAAVTEVRHGAVEDR